MKSSPNGITNRLDTTRKRLVNLKAQSWKLPRMRHKASFKFYFIFIFLVRKVVVCETLPDACVIVVPKEERKDRKAP